MKNKSKCRDDFLVNLYAFKNLITNFKSSKYEIKVGDKIFQMQRMQRNVFVSLYRKSNIITFAEFQSPETLQTYPDSSLEELRLLISLYYTDAKTKNILVGYLKFIEQHLVNQSAFQKMDEKMFIELLSAHHDLFLKKQKYFTVTTNPSKDYKERMITILKECMDL